MRDLSSPDSGIEVDPPPTRKVLPPNELELLRARLRTQQKEKLSRPLLFQTNNRPDLLQLSHIRQLLLYSLIGGDAPGLKPEWCTLVRWQKVSQVVVVALDGITKQDWDEYATDAPALKNFLDVWGSLEPQEEGTLAMNLLESPANRGLKKMQTLALTPQGIWSIDWLIDWSILSFFLDWLIDRFFLDQLIDWLIDWFDTRFFGIHCQWCTVWKSLGFPFVSDTLRILKVYWIFSIGSLLGDYVPSSLLGDYTGPPAKRSRPTPSTPVVFSGSLGDRLHLLMSVERMVIEKYPLPHCSIGGTETGHYVATQDQYLPVGASSRLFAVDCEMCMTSARGSELTRISIVNEQLDVVYDTYVKPFNPIVNYLTKYSGITKAILDPVRLFPNNSLIHHSFFHKKKVFFQSRGFENFVEIAVRTQKTKSSVIDWLIDWLIDQLIDCLIDWLIVWLIDWLIDWLIVWLIDWLIDWLFDWLIDWLIDWLFDLPYHVWASIFAHEDFFFFPNFSRWKRACPTCKPRCVNCCRPTPYSAASLSTATSTPWKWAIPTSSTPVSSSISPAGPAPKVPSKLSRNSSSTRASRGRINSATTPSRTAGRPWSWCCWSWRTGWRSGTARWAGTFPWAKRARSKSPFRPIRRWKIFPMHQSWTMRWSRRHRWGFRGKEKRTTIVWRLRRSVRWFLLSRLIGRAVCWNVLRVMKRRRRMLWDRAIMSGVWRMRREKRPFSMSHRRDGFWRGPRRIFWVLNLSLRICACRGRTKRKTKR